MHHYTIESGSGRHKVALMATVTSGGILATLVGGEEPHLGAVVLTVPRQSLADPGRVSCTSSVLPLAGHKDDEAAKPLAELLAREAGCPVSVAAGIHVHNADSGDIEKLKKNCLDCGIELIGLMKKESALK